MGYTTYFNGSIDIVPPLNEDEISFLKDFATTRRMHRANGPLFVKGEGHYGQGHGPDEIYDSNRPDPDQPGLWCQWVPSEDGTYIDRKSTRLNSSHVEISYAVFCLKKKNRSELAPPAGDRTESLAPCA